jgi:hypothetical protein
VFERETDRRLIWFRQRTSAARWRRYTLVPGVLWYLQYLVENSLDRSLARLIIVLNSSQSATLTHEDNEPEPPASAVDLVMRQFLAIVNRPSTAVFVRDVRSTGWVPVLADPDHYHVITRDTSRTEICPHDRRPIRRTDNRPARVLSRRAERAGQATGDKQHAHRARYHYSPHGCSPGAV